MAALSNTHVSSLFKLKRKEDAINVPSLFLFLSVDDIKLGM